MDDDTLVMSLTPKQWRAVKAMEFVSWAGLQNTGHDCQTITQPSRALTSNEQRTRDAALNCLFNFFCEDLSGPHVVFVNEEKFQAIQAQASQQEPLEAPHGHSGGTDGTGGSDERS